MIHIEQLDFAYSKKQRLFEQLQLKLQAGKIYGLLGKNGAGKTSLLQLMAGLLFP
ncbi:MAG: ATP-binding cassette domain-containing protein, partial [Pseudomonadota bacterium]